ncbi:uncharacterized protein M6B38_298060 [Iris pallida]|uniref:DUF7895 domain-containing protein n=1 Tax=Iris pallida TaxID=29817 RepID=A0AAX6HPL6_IRIPA|nr:uncharacterized protein M6B38_298060 [Iris pallida]
MESTLLTSSIPYTPHPPRKVFRLSNSNVQFASDHGSSLRFHLHGRKQKNQHLSFALPETAASMLLTAVAVGTAATLLVKRTKAASDTSETENSMRECEDCAGSGICAECKGEGFVLKKLSEESADRARLLAKNMATRYTAALPKKWSYCTKCSSARSCRTCGGTGKIS